PAVAVAALRAAPNMAWPLLRQRPGDPPVLPSFPTRRSSDLPVAPQVVGSDPAERHLAVGPHGDAVARARLDPHGLDDRPQARWRDRKSTRLNSSHVKNSYAVFCLKKKRSTALAQNSGSRHRR